MAIFTVRNKEGETREAPEERLGDAKKDGFFPVVSSGSDERRVDPDMLHFAAKDGFSPVRPESLKGEQVAAQPIGPEQASAVDRFVERVKDPARWHAVWNNGGVYGRKDIVQGDVPMVIPAGPAVAAAGKIAQAEGLAGKLSQGMSAPERLYSAVKAVNSTAPGRIAANTVQGGIQGAINAKEGERLDGAIHGAKVGALLGTGAEILSTAVEPVAGWLKGKAGEKSTSAIGATKADMKRLGEKGAERLGNVALDEGVVTPFSTPKSIAEKASHAKESVGEQIGNLIKGADDAGAAKIDGSKIGLELLEHPDVIAAKTTPGGSGLYESASREAETLAQNGEMSLSDAHALRRRIDQNINFNKRRSDLKPGEQEVLYKIRDALNNAINEAVNAVRGGGEIDALKKANASYSNLSRIEDMATNRMAMNSSNRTISLTDTIAGAAGASTGNPALAVGLAGANKLGRTFGKSLQATGARAASNTLAGIAKKVAPLRDNPATTQFVAGLAGKQLREANAPEAEPPAAPRPILGDMPDASRDVAAKTPKRGPAAWTARGLENLGITDPAMAERISSSKEGKRLLIEASDMSPGSKGLNRIKEKIQKGFGQ
jgi:hypothetical protein